ncbi:hypothetical protein [Adonisia turfae]|nr:hypothetical protein [Adonisia turfae]
MDSHFLDTDLLSPAVRRRLIQGSGQLLKGAWVAAPKRALCLYGMAILGAFLVFAPVERRFYSDQGLNYRWPPALGLMMSATGLTLIGMAHAGLDEFQRELDEAEEERQFTRSLQKQAFQDSETSRVYTAVSEVKLQNNAPLPDHMKEPGLVPAKTSQEELEQFKALMGITQDSPEATTTETTKDLKFSTRKNATTKASERCVDLTGKRRYCGLKIENPIPRFLADDRGLLGLGTTGVGKSAFLEAIVSHAYQVDESTDFVAIAHKSGNSARGETLSMAGLEDTHDMYVVTRTMQGQTLVDAATRLRLRTHAIENLLETGSLVPSFVLIDESNEGTKAISKAARTYAELETGGPPKKSNIPDWQEEYSDFIETLIVDGRSKGVRGVVFGHLSTNKSGVDKEVRNQNYVIALGRNGIYGAIESLLSDARYIALKDTRADLKQEFTAYLEQHNANKAPVNVVLALTNIGGQWRLIVLPQRWDIQPIKPSVVNPALDSPYGFEAPAESVPETPTEHLPIDATQQKDPLACYSPRQRRLANEFLVWYESKRSILDDGTGLLDLRIPVQCWDPVKSLSELEMVLEVLHIQGYGDFFYDSVDKALLWKFYPRNSRGKLVARPPEEPGPANQAEPSKLDIPEGISLDAFRYCVKKLFELQVGSIHTVSSFFRFASSLRKNHDLNIEQVHRMLLSKSLKRVIKIETGSYHSKLTFQVLWTPEP